MKKFTLKKTLLASVILFMFSSCHKDDLKNVSLKTPVKGGANTYFNWETAATMPLAPSSPQVSLPWQSMSGSYIDAALLSDYHNNEGWELVYNTFNTNAIATVASEPAGGLYFALYNRYRGLLRFYLYIPTGLFGNSSDIQHGLSVYSANSTTSKMLNFEGTDIVDPNVSNAAFAKTNNSGVAVSGGWYCMQYEIAYDPTFANTGYPNLGFTWNSSTLNISSLSLDGTDVGTLNGNITQSSSSGFNLPGVVKGVGEVISTVNKANNNKENHTFTDKLIDIAKSGIAGNISGILSAILGGSSSSSQEVSLKMNTVISLNGTLSGSQALAPNSLVFPGQTVGNTIGAPLPLYTSPLGVFNLSARPTIYAHKTRQTVLVDDGGQQIPYNQYNIQYSVDEQALYNNLFQTNPNVINNSSTGATIPFSNFRAQVVVIDPNTGYDFNPLATHETIGNLSTYTGPQVNLQYTTEHGLPMFNTQVAVRLIFKVVPNNGAATTTIVKTFTADLVNN